MSIMNTVKRNLKTNSKSLKDINLSGKTEFTFNDNGYGESAILLALLNPNVKIIAHMADDNRRDIAIISAMDFVNNIEFN